jgi:hypothetical protein
MPNPTRKCRKKRYESPEMAMAFARNYIEFGFNTGYGVYHCEQCKGYHLTRQCTKEYNSRVTLKTMGWDDYSPMLELIDSLLGVNS